MMKWHTQNLCQIHQSPNSVWYIFLTSDCKSGRVLQKVTLHTCPYLHHTMYTNQGRVGRVSIRVEIGVHNYITTLTLTTRGTSTFLFFWRRRFTGAWRTRNPFLTRSTRFTTLFKIDVISWADLVQLIINGLRIGQVFLWRRHILVITKRRIRG